MSSIPFSFCYQQRASVFDWQTPSLAHYDQPSRAIAQPLSGFVVYELSTRDRYFTQTVLMLTNS
ncbi:MAG: hypothetical protein ACFE0J_12935 [Elainellaceae cyanobacterium]